MSFQIFIKSFEGSNYTLNVTTSDTVLDIKQKLEDKKGIPVKQQRFIYGYLQFNHGDTLNDYNITKSQSLMMTVIMKDDKSLLVTLDVEPYDTMQTLRQKTMDKENIKTMDIASIYFAGQMPNNKTLSDCNIKDKSTIHLMDDLGIIHSEINDNWPKYQQMFNNMKWKNVPTEYDEEDNNPYYHLVVAINKKTNNTPTKITNKTQFINILKKVTRFRKIDGCKQNANNFYDAYKGFIIDKNIGECKVLQTKKIKVQKHYNTMKNDKKSKQLEMIELNKNNKNSCNDPLIPQHDKGTMDDDTKICNCIIL